VIREGRNERGVAVQAFDPAERRTTRIGRLSGLDIDVELDFGVIADESQSVDQKLTARRVRREAG
jgi:hypothetical protein